LEPRRHTLRYIVTGAAYSGAKIVAEALSRCRVRPCRVECLSPNPETRAADHAAWFGRKTIDNEHFAAGEFNAQQYLAEWVFDRCKDSERATGAYVPYEAINKYDLIEFFEELLEEGDFGVVHLVRHPLSCYAARVFRRRRAIETDAPKIEDYLRHYSRSHAAVAQRLRRDHLHVPYERFVQSPNRCLRRIAQYLDTKEQPLAPRERPRVRERPRCEPWGSRFPDAEAICRQLRDDVRHYFKHKGC
jgi:hypothetical protein